MKQGELWRRMREEKGMSVDQVAQDLGITPDRYQELESGESDLEIFADLMQGFVQSVGVRPIELLYPSGKPFQDLSEYP